MALEEQSSHSPEAEQGAQWTGPGDTVTESQESCRSTAELRSHREGTTGSRKHGKPGNNMVRDALRISGSRLRSHGSDPG